MEQNSTDNCLCKLPCNGMPLVGEASYGIVVKPFAHCDRTAPFHVLIYVLRGSMEIIEDGTAYELTAGTLFHLKSGVHHWGRKPFEAGTAWYYVHFYSDSSCESMPPLKPRSHRDNPLHLSPSDYERYITVPKLLKLSSENEIEQKLAQLIAMHNSGSPIKASLLLWEILLAAWETVYGTSGTLEEDRRTQKVIRFLEHNYCRSFTAAELETALGLSYKYVSTRFKSSTGMGIKEYQLMLRIRKASRLLCETDMPIAQIAAETGFYDTFYFSRTFKREKGLSPLKYRNSYIPGI